MLAAAPRAKDTCLSLPPRAGALILGRAAPMGMRLHPRHALLMARCRSALLPFLRGALGCGDYCSESPKDDALSCVSDAKCALEFNSCYSAIITHFTEYLVTMARALVIRFGLRLLLYFKDLSAKGFPSALKIVYFSICSLQR